MAEMISRRPRPKRSDRIEAGTTHTASEPVAAEIVSAACVELRPIWSTKVGSMACVVYKQEKIARPTKSIASVARRVLVMHLGCSLPKHV